MTHSDSKLPTIKQQRLLSEMLHCALVEIRALGLKGEAKQAAALADAFHNLPTEIWRDYFSVSYFQSSFIEPYLRSWPKGPHDYLAMLHEVENAK